MSIDLLPRLKVKDPAAILVYAMDWGTSWLAVGVTIVTSVWTIIGISTVGAWSGATAYVVGDKVLSGGVIYQAILAGTNHVPPNATYWTVVDALPLTKDQESGVGTRITQLRLSAGTPGTKYTITNRIVTNESPAQTDERSFELLVQDR